MDNGEVAKAEQGHKSKIVALTESKISRKQKIVEKVKAAFSRRKNMNVEVPAVPSVVREKPALEPASTNSEVEESSENLYQNPQTEMVEDSRINEAENEKIESSVYVGLERLDQIREMEDVLRGGLGFAEGDQKEMLEKRITDLKEERNALYKRCGLEEADIERISFNDETGVAKLLTQMATDRLPPVKEGDARMFRGEGPYNRVVADESMSGRWFSPDLGGTFFNVPPRLLPARRMTYVDVPRSSLGQYHAADMKEFTGAGKKDEYVLPREIANKSREFVRFLKADTKGDPWAKPAPAVLKTS